jgi:hypothetical protein
MRNKFIVVITPVIVSGLIFFYMVSSKSPPFKNITEYENILTISPDYTQIVIPPNIAPLNFIIKEENGVKYYVKIHSKKGKTITILNNNPHIKIPLQKWRKLLNKNRGEYLYIDPYVKNIKGTWNKYKTITNKIADEEIDGYLVYRLINPGYRLWEKMGIYIRNIQDYDEKPIMVNNLAKKNCMNCHSFCRNNPGRTLFHVRGNIGGTIVVKDGIIKKINTGTDYTMSAGVYPAWHPDGKLIAFSVNIISQEFYSSGPSSIKVFDKASDLVVYNTESNVLSTSPKISKKEYENMPTWSPDGKYLYYCSAPQPEANHAIDSVKYSLLRISYDAEHNEWGEVETILSSEKTGLSISWPRISPDGRFLMFCMSDYGYFSIYNPGSDLYLMDLKTGEYRSLSINSDKAESYHSWSSNSRWFVFSSKRLNGLCARPYFSYFDKDGNVYKSFIMPQKDPTFYDTFLKNYNIPELVTAPWSISKWDLYTTVNSEATKVEFDKTVAIDALSGATRVKTQNKGNVKK